MYWHADPTGGKTRAITGRSEKTFGGQAKNDVNDGILALEGQNMWKYWKMRGRRLEDVWKTL